MKRLLRFCLPVLLALAGTGCLRGAPAAAQTAPLRIGIASDLNGPYAGLGGKGSLLGAQMAVEDFGGTVLGRPVEVLQIDTQNKPG